MKLITHRAVLHCTQTQTELCKKMGSLVREFAMLRASSSFNLRYRGGHSKYSLNHLQSLVKQELNNARQRANRGVT